MRHIPGSEEERGTLLLEVLRSLGTSVELEALLGRVARAIASAMGAFYCGIFLSHPARDADPNGDRFQLTAASGSMPPSPILQKHFQRGLHPNTDPIVAEIVSSKAPVTIDSSQGRAFLGDQPCASLGLGGAVAVPMISGQSVAGFALSLLPEAGGRTDPEWLEMIEAIAGALTPMVELQRLKEESQRSFAEREAFWHMTSSVLKETDLHRALELVCREARAITGAGGGAILLLEDTGELRLAYSVGDGEDWSDQLLFQAMTSQPCSVPAEPILLQDMSKRLAIPEAELIRSVVVVPLCVHGKSIGVLQMVNPREGLHGDELKAITQLADRVAVVIEHFQLHEKRQKMVVLEERNRMARELHDSVTQSIYAVTVFAEAGARLLDRNQVADAARTLRELRDTALKALREMRALIFELRPPKIEELDLIDALQARLAAVEGRAGLKTEFHYSTMRSLPQDVKEGLYRIVQEALNNSMKHAQASRIVLRLTESPAGVKLELEDDGVGFELDEGMSKGGLGLRGMEERAAAINGTIKIRTHPGGGTSITIDVPLDETGVTSA